MMDSIRLLAIVLSALASIQLTIAGSNPESLKFLIDNSREPGVITHPSGVQYKILEKGDGLEHPKGDSRARFNFEGRLINGKVFDSTYDRGEDSGPIAISPKTSIRGWMEIIPLMVVGDKWELYIPSDMAYGDIGRKMPVVGGGETVIFVMELTHILGPTTPASKCDVITLADCDDKEKGYIEKVKGKFTNAELMWGELTRLQKVSAGTMTDKSRLWSARRSRILMALKEIAMANSSDEL